MKKLLSFLAVVLISTAAFAQSVTLTFIAKDAANQHVQLNRVVISNLTKGWQETIYWPDTTLTMQNGTGIANVETCHGASLQLSQNNPNPFTGTTEVSLMVATEGTITMDIADINGRIVETWCTASLQPGTHQFRITLATAGTYVMTARQNGQTSFIKMVCNGGIDANKMEFLGAVLANDYSQNPVKSNPRGATNNPFTFGDQMEYVGYATINGSEAESQRIMQAQGASQTFTLQFAETQTQVQLPTVTTNAVSNITQSSATVGGTVTSDGGETVFDRGICYSTTTMPTVSNNCLHIGQGTGSFSDNLTGLTANTTYYVRAYAMSSAGTAYGNEVSFTTTSGGSAITVTTNPATDISYYSATCGGNVIYDGEENIIERGVCWNTSPNPNINHNHGACGSGIGSFTSYIYGLNPNTTYYVRAYATSVFGTVYGNEVNFTTLPLTLPTVTTSAVTNITDNSATCGGNVTVAGGPTVTKGVCWSTSQSPTVSDSYITSGTGLGSFTSNITGLEPNTTYYVRAYATNSTGTAYGEQFSFTTLATIPTVTTNVLSNITSNSATCGGYVTFSGGATVTSRGVCWSTSENPTISNSHTTDGSGTGSYTSNITGLTAGTTYYVRAYATNSEGTAYGEQRQFTTNNIPTVTTNTVLIINSSTVECGGNVTVTGGTPVTARGVCWSTSQNPTISNSHTIDGSGIGSFISNITGLTANTTYFVRAYATNSLGTAYGEQRNFTTVAPDASPCTGAVTVTDVDNNTYNTVQIGSQCWMKENLRTTRYANGTSIPLSSSTYSYTEPYRYYPNNDQSNVSTYGYLYNWKAVMGSSYSSSANPSGVQGICPTGWHVPSDAEWTQLTDYVSSQSQYVCSSNSTYIAKALVSTTGWNGSSETCAVGNNPTSNNATGFSALPAGGYFISYDGFGRVAVYWSAAETNYTFAYYRHFHYNNAYVYRYDNEKLFGFSVRCVHD